MSRVTYDAGNLTIEVDGLDTVAATCGRRPQRWRR